MIETPVPADEPDSVTDEGTGTGIWIVVRKEHLGHVLMTRDA
jgi:hypothetical protein